MSEWQPIEAASKDGREILARDANGGLYVVAWSNSPNDDRWAFTNHQYGPGWYRRAGGEWDLFDSFAPQEAEPTSWAKVPE